MSDVPAAGSATIEGVRLALGTLTRIPVQPPSRVDAAVAGTAMRCAPLIGALLAAIVIVGLEVLRWSLPGTGSPLRSLLLAASCVAALAWITRGIHLDGLADMADALASGAPAERALQIARKSDIGPFGVMTLVLVLLIQACGLAVAVDAGRGWPVLAVAVVGSRLTLVWACTPLLPAARADGLGAMVAGTTRMRDAVLLTLMILAAAILLGWCLIGGLAGAALLPTGVLAGLLAGAGVLRAARRRLGGITGDVLGACVECSCCAALVSTALLL